MAMAAVATGRSTVHGASDNEKRWVVFGIVLNKILIHQVRSFVESEVKREYDNLKTSYAVDTQSPSGRLKNWRTFLKYENINGNDALPKKHGKYDYSTFDCRVASHVDFAKLYVENFMAKFNTFDDHCDASAVLSLLAKVPVFSAAVQSAAGDVRQARNAWAHCAFSDWGPVKFRQSFDEMEQLVKALGLLSADEAKLVADLKEWRTKGISFCMNAPVDPALLKLVQHHVSALKTDVDKMSFEMEDDRKEVKKALQDVNAHLDEIEKRVSMVEQDVKHLEIEQSSMEESVDDLQQRSVQIEESMSDLQQRVVQVEERISSVTPQISWEIASCEADIAYFAKRHDPHTRQWLFDDFGKWFRDPGDSRAYVLLGDAGVGKSVIAGALAGRTREAGHLGAAYFCRHNNGTRNDPRYLLGTVACQLCNCNGQYTNMVGGEGGVKTMLANPKLGVQELFTKLLEEPLGKCTPLRERMLVIIDALDETEYESREDFLELIKEGFLRLPDWLVFFITSRPEDTVHSRLERYNPCVRICAGDSEQHGFYEQHEQDIRRFLENGVDFSRFPYTVEEVTKKCNGLFLYAFYIKKELSVQMHSSKHNQIGDLFPEDIKDFFRVNFQRVYDKVGGDIYEKLIGCVLAAPSPLPVSFIPFVLKKEKSILGDQEVIDAVLQFSLNQTANDTVSFLHKLIPTWLTKNQEERKDQRKAKQMQRDCPHLLINKEKAGEYLKSIFSEILSATVDELSPPLSSVEVDMQDYVERVAPRFMCQLGNKDSLNVVFRCLTNYQFLEKRIESGRMEIYNLLEDLKFAADCPTLEDEQKKKVLQEISVALESNVFILPECPHLVHVCLLSTSNSAKETVLIPQKSGPWLDCSVVDPFCTAHLSGFRFFGTSSDKKIVAGAKGRSVIFVDPHTLQILSGPFEVSQDTIKSINYLEFLSDDKYVFFGRLDKWLLVREGGLVDLPQFSGNPTIYDWGDLTLDKQSIAVKRAFQGRLFNSSGTCADEVCLRDFLVLWAVMEINYSSDDNTICFSNLQRLLWREDEIKTTSKELTTHFLRSLQVEHFSVTTVPYDQFCYYCNKMRRLTERPEEVSLAAVRQLIVELYPHIFQYQIWNLQTGKSPLQDVLSLGIQLDPFVYFYHMFFVFGGWIMEAGWSGVGKVSSVCNIAVANAAYALFRKSLGFVAFGNLEHSRKERLLTLQKVAASRVLKKLLKEWQKNELRKEEPRKEVTAGQPCQGYLKGFWDLFPISSRTSGSKIWLEVGPPLEFSEKLLEEWQENELRKEGPRKEVTAGQPCQGYLKGYRDLFPISSCSSGSKKWLVQNLEFDDGRIQLLEKSGIHERQLKYEVTWVCHFSFTNDERHFVYSTYQESLHAICLQTGNFFTSVSGSNVFYFTRERQVGYLFQRGTEERVVFLSNLISPLKIFSLSSVLKVSAVRESMTAIFSTSDTIRSVSSDSSVSLWCITDQGVSFISESSMAGFNRGTLHSCMLSPNGKLIAFHRGNEVGLHISPEISKEEPCIIYMQDHSFTVVFAFSADSSLLYICIQEIMESPRFYLWDVEKKQWSATFKSPGLQNVECFCISPDGRKLILCGEYEIEIWEYDKQLPCRLLARAVVERPYKSVKFCQCAVSSDGELLVCCFANTVILIRLCVPDILSSKRVLRGHLGRIDFCKVLKVNRYLITYGVDGLVILWDLSEAKAATFARITQSQGNIVSMAVSPNEDRAVCFTSCGHVCPIELRRLENALPSRFLTAPGNGQIDGSEENSSQLGAASSSTRNPLTPCTDDGELSSSDSEWDMYYYLEHEDDDEFD